MTHSQACRDSNRFGDGFDCIGEPRCQHEKKPLPTFEQVWAGKVLEGYQYGSDALEQVRFGWELATQSGVSATALQECQAALVKVREALCEYDAMTGDLDPPDILVHWLADRAKIRQAIAALENESITSRESVRRALEFLR